MVREAAEGEPPAGSKRKTRTPHSDVGKNQWIGLEKSIDDTMGFPLPWVLHWFFWGSGEDAICAMATLSWGYHRANMVSHTR